jgi:hypothetical protein
MHLFSSDGRFYVEFWESAKPRENVGNTNARSRDMSYRPSGGGRYLPNFLIWAEGTESNDRFESTFDMKSLSYKLPWWLAMIGWIPAGRQIRRIFLDRRWSRLGLCPVCQYDLRASPQRCPECGTATAGNSVERN